MDMGVEQQAARKNGVVGPLHMPSCLHAHRRHVAHESQLLARHRHAASKLRACGHQFVGPPAVAQHP
eukprot:365920-Chlamydomonas_euryale.AAC.25